MTTRSEEHVLVQLETPGLVTRLVCVILSLSQWWSLDQPTSPPTQPSNLAYTVQTLPRSQDCQEVTLTFTAVSTTPTLSF